MISILRGGEYTFVEKKSKFIASSHTVCTRDDVKAVIAELRRQHRDCRHICYGYIADETGDDFGYYDDGEPNGTAGKPIYQALDAAGVRRSMIAVVRYFGGIKLGAGGLTRAYRQAASGLIERVGTANAQKYARYGVECDGEAFKRISAFARNNNCVIENIEYASAVKFTLCSPENCDFGAFASSTGASAERIGSEYIQI